MEQKSLELFHTLIGQWFRERLGPPTDIQEKAWPVIAKKSGKELRLNFEKDHECFDQYLDFFKVLLTRSFNPLPKITVESINGKKATKSPFLARFQEFCFLSTYKHLELWCKL